MKRILAMAISVILVASMAIGGSIAYLTDTDDTVNVMTMGNVYIEQLENDKAENGFDQGQPLYPAHYETAEPAKPNTRSEMDWENAKGILDKKITVENTGKSEAYVRTWFAFEADANNAIDLIHLNWSKELAALGVSPVLYTTEEGNEYVTIGDDNYVVYSVTYPEALPAKETTVPSLLQVAMDKNATNEYVEHFGDTYEIFVLSQAIQTLNMPEDPAEALNIHFGPEHPWENGVYKTVTTDAELLAAIQDESIDTIRVDGALTYDWGGDWGNNSKALLMKGKTFLGADDEASITFDGYGSANPIVDVTLKDITVYDKTDGDHENSWEHGHLEFEDLNAVNVTFKDSIMLNGDSTLTKCTVLNNVAEWYGLWVNSGNATLEDCTFIGTRAVKIHEYYGSEVTSVTVNNCSFTLSEKPGVVIGDLNAETSVTITNNEFICQPGEQGKYIYESDTDTSTFTFSESGNTVHTDKAFVSSSADLSTAISSGADTVILSEGDFTLSGFKGNDVTLIGAGNDTVIDFNNIVSAGNDDASITFKNMYFEGKNANENYNFGIRNTTGTITYENCTFNNAVTNEFFGNVVYKDCTFTGKYYITTYSVDSATFENCVFDRDDSRAVLVFSHGNNPVNVTLTGCKFKADEKGYTGKGDWTAAVEVDTTNITSAGTTVTINNCTYDSNYSGIVRDKSDAGKANAVITVDNVLFSNT